MSLVDKRLRERQKRLDRGDHLLVTVEGHCDFSDGEIMIDRKESEVGSFALSRVSDTENNGAKSSAHLRLLAAVYYIPSSSGGAKGRSRSQEGAYSPYVWLDRPPLRVTGRSHIFGAEVSGFHLHFCPLIGVK
jgi:hypothetical protein